ncbi:MAG: methionine gamma-lyase family protein [Clostridia bacterium]|nr:methionine gamma-lyase family protein [Clostridia bacterium]
MENAYRLFNISQELEDIARRSEEEIKEQFKQIEETALYNQARVLKAFQSVPVTQVHFQKTTGYGHGDIGREAIEKLYANLFETEDALVRVQFVSGTHTLATALKGVLNYGDEMVAISGRPYDTLCTVIGLEENDKSLINSGIKYSQIDLGENDNFKCEEIKEYLKNNKVKLVHIQRSRGYAVRKALLISDIENVIKEIRSVDKDVIIFVDNCYGEFTEEKEPTAVGADICCGSLIKNAGGGLCEMGGYVCGREDLIEKVVQELYCPGLGKENGATLGQNQNIIQGLFMAPTVVASALKAMTFAARLLENLGLDVFPKSTDKRSDIVQIINFRDKDKLIKFIQGIQFASPIDSNVVPMPWAMPGYADEVIMAAGTFMEGASIELSADSPMREPYAAYMQGGLSYESAKLAILIATQKMLGDN